MHEERVTDPPRRSRYVACSSAHPALHHAHQTRRESAWIDRQLAVCDPGLVEEEMCGVRAEVLVTTANRAQFFNQCMVRIDLQHGLCCSVEPSCTREQPLELTIHPMLGRDETHSTLGQAIGRTDVRDHVAQRLFYEGDKACDGV